MDVDRKVSTLAWIARRRLFELLIRSGNAV
jgi:hypothetical protein